MIKPKEKFTEFLSSFSFLPAELVKLFAAEPLFTETAF